MSSYIGRFAPSPTGKLHFGSLVTAVASYCDAKAHNGLWLLRMEDIDKPREQPGAAEDIINTLSAFGFVWDAPVLFQSQRKQAYQEALKVLQHKNLLYSCSCSRKQIAEQATQYGSEGPIYPRTCWKASQPVSDIQAVRIVTPDNRIQFTDRIKGELCEDISSEYGDFVIRRADGIFAYQLAVVVDDAYQKITHVVRGEDLLTSTTRQIFLQQTLEYSTPIYAHLPLVTNENGQKLSKQTRATPVQPEKAHQLLIAALKFLRQSPPDSLVNARLDTLWSWAIEHWDINQIY